MSNHSESISKHEIMDILVKIKNFVELRLFPIDHLLLKMNWEDALPKLNVLREEVKTQGLWCPQVPVSYGGMGLNNKQFGMVSEILGMSPIGHYVFNCQAPDAGNMEILMEFGTAQQKEKFS